MTRSCENDVPICQYSGRACARKSQRGFVLLIVVFMLAITCLLLYQIAGLAFANVREVVRLEKSEREKWSVVSLRCSLLPQAERLIDQEERSLNYRDNAQAGQAFVPVTRLSGSVEINELTFRIELVDESAKACIPNLLSLGQQWSKNAIQDLSTSSGLRLKQDVFEPRLPSYSWSWDDVFELSHGLDERSLRLPSKRLTLWGNGRTNVYRADGETLDAAWKAVFGHFPPNELDVEREQYPVLPWSELRVKLGLRESQQQLLDQFFMASSNCFSMQLDRLNGFEQDWFFVLDRDSEHHGFQF